MRDIIWKAALKHHPEGCLLPKRLIVLRAILYPLDFFYWKMSESHGYCWQSDTWNIHGIVFSSTALRELSKSEGNIYRVTKVNGCLTFERIDH